MSDDLRQALLEGERAGGRYALRLPRRLPVGVAGGHQGARAGSSLEFREHREYEPGDDLRHIDWNAYARSDQLVVKLYHEEVTPHLDIVLDGSRSMALEGTPAFFEVTKRIHRPHMSEPPRVMIGRTSTRPYSASGIRAAMATARSGDSHWTR